VEVCQKVYKRSCFVSDMQFSVIRQHTLLGNEMSYIPPKNCMVVPNTSSSIVASSLRGPLHRMKQTDICHYFAKSVPVDFEN
jgi:hypothetical protein